MANSPIVTTITGYVDQNRLPLIGKAVLGAPSIKLFNLQTGVKKDAAINLISSEFELAEGNACGWNESGNATLSQRVIETTPFKVNLAFCDKNLLGTWAQHEVRVAAGFKTLPFEEEFINDVIKNVNDKLEKAVWEMLSDAVGASVPEENYREFGDSVPAMQMVNGMVAAIPAAVRAKNDCAVFVPYSVFYAYKSELVAANLFHFIPEDSEAYCTIAGTNIKLYPTQGLEDDMYAGSLSNFFYGTDMVDDQEKFEFWYSQDNREFRLAIEFNAGVQVAYPDEIVKGHISDAG